MPEMSDTCTIVWRRLDSPGHDACRLGRCAGGWLIRGTAVFAADGAPAQLHYALLCDAGWRARRGAVHGWVGAQPVAVRVDRHATLGWRQNGRALAGLDDCVDLDLGFTPATNAAALRRLALDEGQSADAPAAWLDLGTAAVERLEQRYARLSATAYWYEGPRFGYQAELEVAPVGLVVRYPGLWEMEAGSGW